MFKIATVPLPVQTGACCECEQLTTSKCLSCLLPLCNWCSRDCEPGICPWCHFMRGCDKPDCAASSDQPRLPETGPLTCTTCDGHGEVHIRCQGYPHIDCHERECRTCEGTGQIQ